MISQHRATLNNKPSTNWNDSYRRPIKFQIIESSLLYTDWIFWSDIQEAVDDLDMDDGGEESDDGDFDVEEGDDDIRTGSWFQIFETDQSESEILIESPL